MKKSEKVQKAAVEAHKRGKAALEKGDLKTAFAADDESDALALEAMLRRMQGQ